MSKNKNPKSLGNSLAFHLNSSLIDVLKESAKLLRDGNQKSKDMASVLALSLRLLESGRFPGDKIKPLYETLASVHNSINRELGGGKEYKSFEIEDVKAKTGIDFERIYEGVNVQGLMALQNSLPLIRKLRDETLSQSLGSVFKLLPDMGGGFQMFYQDIEIISLLSILSAYNDAKREEILKILRKYSS
jgi:hypothetical protein